MADPLEGRELGSGDPARNAAAVTPDDAADLATFTRGLYVGVDGNVRVHMTADAAEVTFVGVAAGSVLPVSVRRVLATGTTATDIVALW